MHIPSFPLLRPTRPGPGRLGAVLALTLAVLAACDDGSTDPDDGVVAVVEVSAPTEALEAGATLQLTATARSASGRILTGHAATWSSSDTTVARIAPGGVLTALRAGEVSAEATVDGKRGSRVIQITTNPVPVAQTLTPSGAVVGSPGLTVAVHGDRFVPGALVYWRGAQRPTTRVSWTELRAEIPGGDLALVGTADVKVVNPGPGGGSSASLDFPVSPVPVAWVEIEPGDRSVHVGDSIRLTATARDAGGGILEGRTVSWSSGRTDIAGVSEDGFVRGVAPGAATITATSEGKSQGVVVTVTEGPNPVITSLTPDSVPARADSLTVTIRGTGFTPTTVAVWQVTQPTDYVGPTELRMFFFPGDLAANGTRTIRVHDPVTGRWSNGVPFLVRGITQVEITGPRELWVGETGQLSAVGTDHEGTTYPPRPVEWTSSRPDVATVGADGSILALAPGTTTITATMAGRSRIHPVRVLAPLAFDLLYEAVAADSNVPELWRVAPGAGTLPWPVLPRGTFARTPAVSRDGSMIAYAGADGQIWVMTAEGAGRRAVTTDGMPKDQPAWSPDGSRIAFRVQRSGETEIGIVNADGTGQALLTWPEIRVAPMIHQRPTWNPDGTRIVYAMGASSFSPVTLQLMSMEPDGTDRRFLTTGAFSDTDPAFSFDGRMLAVSRTWATPGPGLQLTLLDPDGEPWILIDPPGPGRQPAWSPDGWLAFIGQDLQGNPGQLVVTRPGELLRRTIVEGAASPVWIPRD